jgi:hypothetical protein
MQAQITTHQLPKPIGLDPSLPLPIRVQLPVEPQDRKHPYSISSMSLGDLPSPSAVSVFLGCFVLMIVGNAHKLHLEHVGGLDGLICGC